MNTASPEKAAEAASMSVSGNISKIEAIIERNKMLMDKYNIPASKKSPKPPSLLSNKNNDETGISNSGKKVRLSSQRPSEETPQEGD